MYYRNLECRNKTVWMFNRHQNFRGNSFTRNDKILNSTVVQCFLSRFCVSKWHPKILQWHPKFWKPRRYGFALYWSKTIWGKHVFLLVAIAAWDAMIGPHNSLAHKLEAEIIWYLCMVMHIGVQGGGRGGGSSPDWKFSGQIFPPPVKCLPVRLWSCAPSRFGLLLDFRRFVQKTKMWKR